MATTTPELARSAGRRACTFEPHPQPDSAIVPRFSPQQAQDLAARHYDLRAVARELPSYIDQNFHLIDAAGAEYVLKISNSGEDPGLLEAQVSALDLLQASAGHLATPRVVRCVTGSAVTRDGDYPVWLVTYLPGRLLADVSDPPEDLLLGLGRGLGDLDHRLETFDHPAARRMYSWDLRQAAQALAITDRIREESGRSVVRVCLERFRAEVLPMVERLPFQVIHNDANDHNILVNDDGLAARVCGLLDFGDLVWSARACEPAIAMTYAMIAGSDPLKAGALVLAGYHESLALSRPEIRVVPYLIEARLCVSVAMSSHRRESDPGNTYLSVSEAPAWRLLDWMSTCPPSRWIEVFEDACASVGPVEGDGSPRGAGDEA